MEKTRVIMGAQVKADCYGGPECDQVRNYFSMYCDGDKEGSDGREDIVLKCAELPPGTLIEVRYPCCPKCGLPRMDKFEAREGGTLAIVGHEDACECGFDWRAWVLNRYA